MTYSIAMDSQTCAARYARATSLRYPPISSRVELMIPVCSSCVLRSNPKGIGHFFIHDHDLSVIQAHRDPSTTHEHRVSATRYSRHNVHSCGGKGCLLDKGRRKQDCFGKLRKYHQTGRGHLNIMADSSDRMLHSAMPHLKAHSHPPGLAPPQQQPALV